VIICGRVRVSGKLFVRVIQPKLPKFIKVTAKILSVFFSGHGVFACTPKLFGGGRVEMWKYCVLIPQKPHPWDWVIPRFLSYSAWKSANGWFVGDDEKRTCIKRLRVRFRVKISLLRLGFSATGDFRNNGPSEYGAFGLSDLNGNTYLLRFSEYCSHWSWWLILEHISCLWILQPHVNLFSLYNHLAPRESRWL